MPAIVIDRIGPEGSFATLAEWAAALPADLTQVDEVRIAELARDVIDPGNAVIQTICDATRFVVIRAEAGASVADLSDPNSTPLRVETGQGALIHAASGDAVSLSGSDTRVEVHGIQVLTDAGAALAEDISGAAFTKISGCILDANASVPVVTVRKSDSEICASVVVQRGSGDGVALVDGAGAEGCTVFKPIQSVATGTGVSADGAGSTIVRSVAASGFGLAFDADISIASNLASDQMNLLQAPDDLTDPYWTRVSAGIDGGDTIVGPTGIALQRVSNNLNGFSFFSASVVHTLAPGARFAFSMIVSDVSAQISALLIDSTSGKPEMRVNWTGATPVVNTLGATAPLRVVEGTATDLGGGAYRMYLQVENTTAAPIDVTPIFYVTRGVENVGLDVGMYAGAAMAGDGHLGNGFAYAGSVPGTDPVEGVDPSAVYLNDQAPLWDLRPVAGSALEVVSGGGVIDTTDLYRRYRQTPETIGSVALNAEEPTAPDDVIVPVEISMVHALDEAEIIQAFRSRTVLPASPVRVVHP